MGRIVLAVALESYRPRKDKTFTITFSTSELTQQQVMELHGLHNRVGAMVFADKEVLDAEDLVVLDSTDLELQKKSYSQRLRNVLYVLHTQLGGNDSNFKAFYEQQMERLINSIKEKLEP